MGARLPLGHRLVAGGVANNDPLLGLNAAAVEVWIGNYCQAHPLVYVGEAAVAFDRTHPNAG